METSRLVAERLRAKEWSFAFQSASSTGEPWLGPDILQHLETLYSSGRRSFVLAPVGFVSDHLEILYDIDVECTGWAREKGAKLSRCQSPQRLARTDRHADGTRWRKGLRMRRRG